MPQKGLIGILNSIVLTHRRLNIKDIFSFAIQKSDKFNSQKSWGRE
jgi:hypothetical protein